MFLKTGKKLTVSSEDRQLLEERADFVTLYSPGKRLRGCIGRTEPESPLLYAVRDMAIEAAIKDSRFPRVTAAELADLSIEISVLGPTAPITGPEEIRLGEDGVVVEHSGRRGLFLPEVAQHFATKKEFLEELCEQKAGLPRSCWKDPATKFSVFQTLVFRDPDQPM